MFCEEEGGEGKGRVGKEIEEEVEEEEGEERKQRRKGRKRKSRKGNGGGRRGRGGVVRGREIEEKDRGGVMRKTGENVPSRLTKRSPLNTFRNPSAKAKKGFSTESVSSYFK